MIKKCLECFFVFSVNFYYYFYILCTFKNIKVNNYSFLLDRYRSYAESKNIKKTSPKKFQCLLFTSLFVDTQLHTYFCIRCQDFFLLPNCVIFTAETSTTAHTGQNRKLFHSFRKDVKRWF